MTATTRQVVTKIVEFYGEEIAVLRAFEERIKGKQTFKGSMLELMGGKNYPASRSKT